MRITTAIAAALALGAAGTPAAAEDWRLVSASTRGTVFVDADSITRKGRKVTFTFWLVYAERAEGGADNARARRRAGCNDYSFTDLERSFFYERNLLERAGEQPPERSEPGSLNYWTIRYACVGAEKGQTYKAFADPYKAVRDGLLKK